MNQVFRIIWSETRQCFVVAHESAKAHGKRSSSSSRTMASPPIRSTGVAAPLVAHLKGALRLAPLALLAASLFPLDSMAAPIGGQVTAGQGSITQRGATTTIHQASQHLSLNWKGFNVAPAETVNFKQPNTQSIAVNRIFDANGSRIMGHLNANGQVYLINPNGILFGKGAQVNVGGLVASTMNISDAALGKAQQTFAGKGAGSIINNGTIHATSGGYVALLGNQVTNNGIITAQLGTVAMGAGNQVTLTFNGNHLLKIQVDKSVLDSLAANHGLIQADGGIVAMNAGARDALLASVVNNDGIIQARTIQNHNGKIMLLGGMAAGTATVAGTLDASAPNGGNGGFIETSAAQVKVADTAKITTRAASGLNGTWLIDPKDFTIAATGGDITGSALSNSLGGGNVTIKSSSGTSGTAGDINVNDTVTWNANTLTLNAQNNININSVMNGSGTASLALQYGQGALAAGNTSTYNVNAAVNLAAGNHFSTQLGSDGTTTPYTVITALGTAGSTTKTDLQGMGGSLSTNYALGANIDAGATSTWNSGAGFTPVGSSYSYSTRFNGTFDGLGHTIKNLTINSSSPTGYIGLFGAAGTSLAGTGGIIRNIGMIGGSINGSSPTGGLVGGLVGYLYGGSISNSYATGSVSSSDGYAGGLVGYLSGGTIRNSHATGGVTSSGDDAGGLVGYLYSGGSISNSYATGSVTASGNNAGGLVGYLTSSTISNSYATGSVTASVFYAGGLVGYSAYSSISNSYATGSVSSVNYAGGLVGDLAYYDTISNSYATGSVPSGIDAGGLVGYLDYYDTISNSFWDKTTTGQSSSSGGGVGMTTTQMQKQTNFTSATAANGSKNPGWDFTHTWVMYNGHTDPLLRSFMTPLTVTANNDSKIYDTVAYSGSPGVVYSATPNANLLGTPSYGGSAAGAVNAGSYSIVPSGLYSTKQRGGYAINFIASILTINKAPISAVTGITASNKVYDATTTATLNSNNAGFTGVFNGDKLTVAMANGLFTNKNVANAKIVTISGIILGGADAGNYKLGSTTASTTANITPAPISAVTGITANNKVYDATTTAPLNSSKAVFAGMFSGDTLTVATANGLFANKNVGTNKTVTISGISLGGADAGNYNLGSTTAASTTASITPAPLNVTGLSASSKVYDATTAEALSGTAVAAPLSGDSVTLAGTASGLFANKNVGTNKTITISGISLSGTDASNYNMPQQAGLTADITPASISAVTGITANNKVYDATTTAPLNSSKAVFTGIIGSDNLTIAMANGLFANKNVGTSKTVTISGISLGGTDAGNYNLGSTTTAASTTANITKAPISAVTGITANNKVYDATMLAMLNNSSAKFTGIISGDTLTVATASGLFADKNVGTNKTVTIGGISLGGADAGNYNLGTTTTASTTASITKANLNATGLTASNRVYNATTAETLGGTAAISPLGNDFVILGGTASGSFTDKNVGTGKTVIITGNTLSGPDAGNYNPPQQAGLTATITPATINAVTGITASNKVYDATIPAMLNSSKAKFTGIISGDTLTVATASGLFADKNVGTNKTVTIGGISLGGADAGNYNLGATTTAASTTANITPATLTYSATPVHILQAQPLSLFSGKVTGFVGGDILATATNGSLTWTSPVGSSNTPGHFAINGSGLTAANYVFSQAAGNATALTIQAGRVNPSVENVITQVQSSVNIPLSMQGVNIFAEDTGIGNVPRQSSNNAPRQSTRIASEQNNNPASKTGIPSYFGSKHFNFDLALLTVEGRGIRLPKLMGK